MIQLSNDFVEKIEGLLKEEFAAFSTSYEEKKSSGLRVNTLPHSQCR